MTSFERVSEGRGVLSHGRLSQLIGSIYDCALDPSAWELTLAAIAVEFECTIASLTLNDLRGGRFLINKAAGCGRPAARTQIAEARAGAQRPAEQSGSRPSLVSTSRS